MITKIGISQDPDNQRIFGHRLGFSHVTQSPVSALMFLSYQPDMTGYQGAPIAAVIAEIGGQKYDQVLILQLIESTTHNRLELSKALLKAHDYRPVGAIYCDIETARWFNADLQFTNLAETQKDARGWADYPAVLAVDRYQLKSATNLQAQATAWQSTVLDQVESMRDSNGQPVLRYVKKILQDQSLMTKFSLRGKSVAVDALAGAVFCMLRIADDLRWQYQKPTAS